MRARYELNQGDIAQAILDYLKEDRGEQVAFTVTVNGVDLKARGVKNIKIDAIVSVRK